MNDSFLLRQKTHGGRGALLAALTIAALTALPVGATQIWNGPSMSFTNLAGSDPTLPSSQDRITSDVWLTPGAIRGLYNAAVEGGYSPLSPVSTEWTCGELPNHASLSYQAWLTWNGKNPPPWWGKTQCFTTFPRTFF
jgi:hypothetical protein